MRPLTSTLWSTAPPVVFTRKRMRPLICTPPVANAALPVRKPAMPSVLSTRTPSPSLSVSWDPTLTVASGEGRRRSSVLALVEEGAGERALGERGGDRALGAAQAGRRVQLQARVGERGREVVDAVERGARRACPVTLSWPRLLLERERAGRGQARAGGLADAEARQREREVRQLRRGREREAARGAGEAGDLQGGERAGGLGDRGGEVDVADRRRGPVEAAAVDLQPAAGERGGEDAAEGERAAEVARDGGDRAVAVREGEAAGRELERVADAQVGRGQREGGQARRRWRRRRWPSR